MKLVFCNHCWFVYIDPAGTPGHDGRPVKLEACPQCFGNGGGKLLPVPTTVTTPPHTPRTFPIATTPAAATQQED